MALKLDYESLGYGPPHPGAILREEILPRLALTRAELAQRLGIAPRTLCDLLAERRAVSLAMAQRLGKAFGTGARYWLALQMQHDVWHAERAVEIDVEPILVDRSPGPGGAPFRAQPLR